MIGEYHRRVAFVAKEDNSAQARPTAITPLELQSRFGDKELKFQVICPQLSPKRGCSPKRANRRSGDYGAQQQQQQQQQQQSPVTRRSIEHIYAEPFSGYPATGTTTVCKIQIFASKYSQNDQTATTTTKRTKRHSHLKISIKG